MEDHIPPSNPSALISSVKSALVLLQSLQRHGQFTSEKKKGKVYINTTERVYINELTLISELQALLYIQLCSIDLQLNDNIYTIDIDKILHTDSTHLKLMKLRKNINLSKTADQTEQDIFEKKNAEELKQIFNIELSKNMFTKTFVQTNHNVKISNGIQYSELVPICTTYTSPVYAKTLVSKLFDLLVKERLKIQTIEEILNDDCFSILRYICMYICV